MVRILILKSGAPHQSQGPSSESMGGQSTDLIIRAPHQSGPSSGIRGGKSSDLKPGAPHQSQAPSSSEFRGGKSSDLKIRGAPSVPGSILGDQGW